MRKYAICAVLLTVSLCLPAMPVQAADDNSCGEHITWSFDEDTKTLTLTGTGEMYDYEDWLVGTASVYPPWHGLEIQQINVSEGIESIGNYAFSLCWELESVSLPDSLRRIGKMGFSYTGLTSFETSAAELGESALSLCRKLEKVHLKSGVEKIGDFCFDHNVIMEDFRIPDTVTEVGWNAFRECTKWYQAQTDEFVIAGDGILCQYTGSASEVIIPETVRQIAAGAFSASAKETDGIHVLPVLYSIEIPATVHSLPAHAFEGLESTVTVKLPDTLESIGEKAFADCKNLKNLTIPNAVRYIGSNAFDNTMWINDIQSSDVSAIVGDGLLVRYRGNGKILRLDETIKAVCDGAISGRQILEVIFTVPDTVINPNAFTENYIVIGGLPGSTAEQYARENGMQFRDITAVPDGPDMTLDIKKEVWSFCNNAYDFGEEYVLTDEARQQLADIGADTESIDRPWGGSCGGMSTAVVLMKNGVFSPAQLQSGAENLSDVKITDSVRSFVNYYQCIQGRDAFEPELNKIYRMLQIAENIPHGESPFLLTFALEKGSHGTVGYGRESGKWTFDGKTYDGRILVWDPNYPTEFHAESCLYYDSETLEYCIPAYGIHVADNASDNVGRILTVCNDLSVLNPYPYPFPDAVQGDLNLDGSVTVADAVLLSRFLTAEAVLSESQRKAADLSGDHRITAADLTLLKRSLLH